MSAANDIQVWTEAALMALPEDGHQYEFVDGEVRDMGNSGMEHGYIACLLVAVLTNFVLQHRLGAVCDSSTGFALKSGNIRSPDVSFVARSRLQGLKRPPRGFFAGSPDLAVEILSPNNTVEEIHAKIVEYFDNQTQLVWVIHPDEQFVLVYRQPSPDRLLRPGDELDGNSIVPGFSMPVAQLFESWDF